MNLQKINVGNWKAFGIGVAAMVALNGAVSLVQSRQETAEVERQNQIESSNLDKAFSIANQYSDCDSATRAKIDDAQKGYALAHSPEICDFTTIDHYQPKNKVDSIAAAREITDKPLKQLNNTFSKLNHISNEDIRQLLKKLK